MKRNAQSTQEPTSCLTVMIAGFGLVAFTASACALVFAVLGPIAVGLVLIPMSIFSLTLMHYMLWGWWIGKAITDTEAEEIDTENPSSE